MKEEFTPSATAPSLGFRFTPNEEAAMKRVCKSALKFMRTFGQGQEPYMVDTRHYIMGEPNQSV